MKKRKYYIDETYKSSYPEPLGLFQLSLAESILGWREFNFVQMKGYAIFQGEIIINEQKYIDKILKIFSSRTDKPLSTKLKTKHF